MAYYCIVVLTVSLSVLACSASPICYNCTGVTNMDACQDKVSCGENEVCFNQRKSSGNILYDLGCIESKKCGDFADLLPGISKMDNDKEQTQSCFECCSKDRCNINLCQYKDPSLCVDDEKINCAYYNALFNFCDDVDKAKIACPKYCNLCRVDGNWTPWSNWSDCDVTCDNGTQIRTRSCTYPTPQNGGLDCLGNDTETKSCHREPCPIHGGWNTWSTWSECSVSCDIGMQHRDRLCTNPRPSLFGDHCFGYSREDRICMPGACADGGWSSWGRWGACSESCEGGIMSRTRACTNPAPSMIGKQCVGNSEQVRLCNKQACKDGGWSNWGSWGTCSVSCTGGIMSRYRACSNPAPSVSGKQCMGNSEQVRQCNKQACPENNVAFTAYNVNENSLSTTLLFHNIYINYGSGYSTTTGKFTCKIPGVYHFVVTLLKVYKDINIVSAYLRINGSNRLQLYFQPKDDGSNEVGLYMMTCAGTFHLDKNDVVYVYGISNNFVTGYNSCFTGFLITPDQ